MRISASLFRRLSAFFGSAPGQDPKAAKFAVLIPGPGMFVNVQYVSRVVIPPPVRKARVSPCEPLCAILLAKASVLPAFGSESERGPFVREAEKRDERWSEIELLLIIKTDSLVIFFVRIVIGE